MNLKETNGYDRYYALWYLSCYISLRWIILSIYWSIIYLILWVCQVTRITEFSVVVFRWISLTFVKSKKSTVFPNKIYHLEYWKWIVCNPSYHVPPIGRLYLMPKKRKTSTHLLKYHFFGFFEYVATRIAELLIVFFRWISFTNVFQTLSLSPKT